MYLLIVAIIACIALVIYGSSATTVREGLSEYLVAPVNTLLCPPGYYNIMDQAECKEAAENLGGYAYGGTNPVNEAGFVSGCYYYDNGLRQLQFNIAPDSGVMGAGTCRGGSTDVHPICKAGHPATTVCGKCPHGTCANGCGGCTAENASCGAGSNGWCDCHTKDSCTCTRCSSSCGSRGCERQVYGEPPVCRNVPPPPASGPECDGGCPAACRSPVCITGGGGAAGHVTDGTCEEWCSPPKLTDCGRSSGGDPGAGGVDPRTDCGVRFCMNAASLGPGGFDKTRNDNGGSVNCTGCKGYTPPSPPPSETCAAYLSHAGGCGPTGTAKGANTPCSATNFGDCYDYGKCGCKCYIDGTGEQGQPRCLPSTSNTGKGRWPNTTAKDYYSNMNCGTCLPRGTEEECALMSGLCYWGLPSDEPIANACPNSQCSNAACCNPNPTCSSSGITCPFQSFMPKATENKQCAGSTCDNTPGGECCQWNPTCPAGICNATTQLATGVSSSSGRCAARTCTPGECCTDRGNCVNTPCPPDLWDTGGCPDATAVCNNQGYCAHAQCQTTECCTPDPNCTTFTCPPYYSTKQTINPAAPSPQELKCGVGEVCNTGDCCALNPLCSSFTCPQHEELKTTAAQIRCIGPTCTPKECCGLDPKCDSFECTENSFYHTYQPIPDAANTWCVSAPGTPGPCTESQCCTATPTYALAEVKTWPLYPENYQ